MTDRKDSNKQANQTGSQSGNPRNQQLQREQSGNGSPANQPRSKGVDKPRKRKSNRSGGDKRHGGNR